MPSPESSGLGFVGGRDFFCTSDKIARAIIRVRLRIVAVQAPLAEMLHAQVEKARYGHSVKQRIERRRWDDHNDDQTLLHFHVVTTTV